jgi:hypothetical protein
VSASSYHAPIHSLSLFTFFDSNFIRFGLDAEEENESKQRKDKTGEEMVLWGLEKWRQSRGLAEAPRYVEKAPKFVSHRISPRTIHQPK